MYIRRNHVLRCEGKYIELYYVLSEASKSFSKLYFSPLRFPSANDKVSSNNMDRERAHQKQFVQIVWKLTEEWEGGVQRRCNVVGFMIAAHPEDRHLLIYITTFYLSISACKVKSHNCLPFNKSTYT